MTTERDVPATRAIARWPPQLIAGLGATPRGLNITPVFSADNKSVIYANGNDSRTSLVAVRLDSATSVQHLPLNRSFDADEPILSPDGSRIAYVSSRPKTPQIYSSNLDGTDERVEAPAPPKTRVYHTSPDWSPDGRKRRDPDADAVRIR